MMRKAIMGVLSAAVAVFSFSQSALAAGATSEAKVEVEKGASGAACENWHSPSSVKWGYALGTECKSGKNATVHGWVTDKDADGQCVYVHVDFAASGPQDSKWACPEGKKIEFKLTGTGDARNISIRRIPA
ncbi:hypothetical protein [Archangium lipolyticum]|uniref:hypothetical protein n=1 Tax=Archangium lipolyticum TaxID=2970465 RepID=UPI00214A1B10|nr:hypothetical protein [Archangium lipolyticum]